MDDDAIRADQQELLNALMGLIGQLLTEQGGFYPLGAAVADDGELSHVNMLDEDVDDPDPMQVHGRIVGALRRQAEEGTLRASAVASDVTVTSEGITEDAIAVELEHRHADPVVVIVPYEVEEGEVSLGEPFAQDGERAVFAA